MRFCIDNSITYDLGMLLLCLYSEMPVDQIEICTWPDIAFLSKDPTPFLENITISIDRIADEI